MKEIDQSPAIGRLVKAAARVVERMEVKQRRKRKKGMNFSQL